MGVATWMLLAAAACLFVGPLLQTLPARSGLWRASVGAFTVTTIAGLCGFVLLPGALERGGWFAALAALIGALSPALLGAHGGSARGLLLGGVLVHAVVEGAALGASEGGQGALLGAAIALHQIPLGLAVFNGVREGRAARLGWWAVAAVAIATVVGFSFGPAAGSWLGDAGVSVLEALVAGLLLHVAWDERSAPVTDAVGRFGGLPGALVGASIVAGLAAAPVDGHGHGHGGPLWPLVVPLILLGWAITRVQAGRVPAEQAWR